MEDSGIAFHRLPHANVLQNRDNLILSLCRGKNVLNLGCVGSLDSFRKGISLHLKMLDVASRVIGVDIDKNAIEYLKQQGIPDLICADVQALNELIEPEIMKKIDVIVAGEILEHLPNPGLCLNNVARMMHRKHSILIITVPCAFSFRNFISVLSRNRELVRSDHNYYFSYMTIKSLLIRCGFSITDIYTYSNLREGQNPLKKIAKMLLNNIILKHSPFLAEGLVVLATKQEFS